MLQQDTSAAHKTIVEQSSGSTAMSLGLIGRILYDNKKCRAFVSNKAGASRMKQLRFFGIEVYAWRSYCPLACHNRELICMALLESFTEDQANLQFPTQEAQYGKFIA